MSTLRAALLLSVAMLTVPVAYCQQEPMPDKLSPEVIQRLREQEQQMVKAVQDSNKQSGPKFAYLQCRADAQKWTADPFDTKDARNLMVNTAIMVNGQFRSIQASRLTLPSLG